VIIGPPLSGHSEYATDFYRNVERHPGIFYLPELSQEDLHSAMSKSTAIVNSSISEGLSNALLEALYPGQYYPTKVLPLYSIRSSSYSQREHWKLRHHQGQCHWTYLQNA
jgi:hypothetical protein